MIETFGKRLKNSRTLANLTLEEVTKVLKISKQTLINYECDKKSPNSKTISKMIDLYKTTPNYLFSGQITYQPKMKSHDKLNLFNLVSLYIDKAINIDYSSESITINDESIKNKLQTCTSLVAYLRSCKTTLETHHLIIKVIESDFDEKVISQIKECWIKVRQNEQVTNFKVNDLTMPFC